MILKLDDLKQNNFGLQSQLEDTKKKLENELKILNNKINDLKAAEINVKEENKNLIKTKYELENKLQNLNNELENIKQNKNVIENGNKILNNKINELKKNK